VVGGAARFHHDRGRRLLGEECQELGAAEALTLGDASWPIGDRDLEHGLCDVDGNARRSA
jgi:hypothetical protein